MLWRALVAWCLTWPAMLLAGVAMEKQAPEYGLGIAGLLLALALISALLPVRGLPDRLAGTWPVNR